VHERDLCGERGCRPGEVDGDAGDAGAGDWEGEEGEGGALGGEGRDEPEDDWVLCRVTTLSQTVKKVILHHRRICYLENIRLNNTKSTVSAKQVLFRPGVAVKAGKLYVYSKKRVIVVRGWPEMAAWTRSGGRSGWARIRPNLNLKAGLLVPLRSKHRELGMGRHGTTIPEHGWRQIDEESTDFERWLAQRREEDRTLTQDYFSNIPQPVKDAVVMFPSRHWHLLVLTLRCEGGLELLQSNPALGFCLASCWVFSNTPSCRASAWMRQAVKKRRRDILGMLGFPATQSAVAVLQKVDAATCTVPALLGLRGLLAEPVLGKTLAHLPAITPRVLAVLGSPALKTMASPGLLHELARPAGCEEPDFVRMMRDARQMALQLGDASVAHRPVTSLHQLRRLHDGLVQLLQSSKLDELIRYRFPSPPVNGTATIVPLHDPKLVIEEGRQMRHCISMHISAIAAGDFYAYRLLQPERATLLLGITKRGWSLSEIQGYCNSPVREDTIRCVGEWLACQHDARGSEHEDLDNTG